MPVEHPHFHKWAYMREGFCLSIRTGAMPCGAESGMHPNISCLSAHTGIEEPAACLHKSFATGPVAVDLSTAPGTAWPSHLLQQVTEGCYFCLSL